MCVWGGQLDFMLLGNSKWWVKRRGGGVGVYNGWLERAQPIAFRGSGGMLDDDEFLGRGRWLSALLERKKGWSWGYSKGRLGIAE